MSLRTQSWIATLLLVGGFLVLMVAWTVPELRWLSWISLGCIGLGLLVMVVAFGRAAREISRASERLESKLKDLADRMQKEPPGKKPGP